MAEHPSQIGRYKIQEELGRGGFGRVYRAFDPIVGRPVAIKMLTEVSADTQTRFRNEAKVAGNLRHKNIVTVYEYGTYEGSPFLTMEYLEGEDLQQIIASRSPLSLLEKCNIMSQVADGLYYAHNCGVVHRDMKPANIMVLRDGTVKIMDFGIARLTRTPDATRLTQQGSLIGTLRYMAPEQLAGTDFDAQCDIFAYGVIFYELVTGQHPFEAADPQRLMYKLTFEEPTPIREFAPGIPDALQDVISRMIHKDREQRYRNLKDLQFDTEPIRIGLQGVRASEFLMQAQELFRAQQLEPAQKVLQEALALDPSNKAARALWERLQQQLQQRTLQPRIEALLCAAEEHLVKRRFADAAQSFESALLLDRENVYIQGRLDEARALVEHAWRASQLVAEARRELEHQNLTAAYRIVSEALRHDPKNPEAAEFLKTIQSYLERRQAQQRVEDAIRKAQGLMLVPAYDEALAVLTASDSESPKIREWLERVRSEKLAYERKQKLHREMAAATDLLREQRLDEAAKCLESLRVEFPENQDVAQLLAYAQREQTARARSKAVESAAAEARALAESRDFNGALATLDSAMRKFPSESLLVRLLGSTMTAKGAWERQQAVQAAVAKCEALRSKQRFAEAVRTVEAALENHSAEPALLNLLKQLEAELTQQRRNEAVRQLRNQAEQLLEQMQFGAAVEALQEALVRYPGDATLEETLRRSQAEVVAREKARAAERADAIDKRGKEALARTAAGDLEGALALLDDGLRNWPDAASLLEIRKSTLAERERRAKRQRVLQDLEELRVLALQESGTSATAEILPLALSIASEFPEDEEIQSVASGPIGLLQDIERVRQHLAESKFQAALAICESRLAQHPDHAAFHEYQREAERGQRRSFLVELQRRAAAEPDLKARARLFERGLELYPDETAVADLLRFTRKRLELVDSIVEQARACEGEGRWDEAVEKWSSLLGVYSQYPELQAEIGRVQRAREKALSEAVEREARQVEQALAAGEPGAAAALLRQAQIAHPDAPVWRDLARRCQEIEGKRKRARALLAQAHAAARSGRFGECQTCLRQAFQTDESDAALRKDVLNKLVEYAQSAIQVDWRQAEALVGEARSLQRGYAVPSAVLQAIAAARKQAANTPPRPPEQRREAVAIPAVAMPPSTVTARSGADARGSDRSPDREGGVARNSQSPVETRGPIARRPLLATGVAVASLAGAAIAFRSRGSGEIVVNVASNVSGAAVSVGDKTCVTPNCDLKLAPGTYVLQGARDGYQPTTQRLTLTRGQAATNLELALKPLPELLQVNTNFESGKLYLDGRLEGELRDGQFTASGITPGRHTIRVTGGGTEFQAEWKSVAGTSPEMLQFSSGKDLRSTVVANAGSTASISCNCDNTQVAVDGVPAAGATPSSRGSVLVKGMKEGPRQIALAGHSLVVDIRPNPALNIFLSLDRNVGMLIVETGEDGVKVFLNNRLYRRTTEHGMLRIPVEAGEYVVRAEKEGFLTPSAQTIALQKGTEKPLIFALARASARLELAGAAAGAQVRLDGQSIGETDPSGALRHEVTPGTHTIELSKDDYAPIRLTEQFRPGKTLRLDRGQVAMAKAAKATPDPKQLEAQDWAQLASSTNPDDFDAFLRNHPGGAHFEQARSRSADLRQQIRSHAAQQVEQASWEKVDPNSREQLLDYLSRYPAGTHVQEARARIAEADRKAADALAAQRSREQKDQEQARRAADEQAIVKVVRDFEAAYNQKDLSSLQRLWNGLPVGTYRGQFRDSKDLKFQLQITGQPIVNGDGATVICTRSLVYRGQSGGVFTSNDRVKITLGREGSGWLIRGINLN